jgi:type IV fimbrial biogenesis protein FimT
LRWSLIMEDARHSGFTLIELLVTVSLVALLTGLAVPAMGRFIDSARLRGAAETLVQELRDARNRAITFQQTIYFSFSRSAAENWCYGWSNRAACDCRLDAYQPDACLNSPETDTGLHRRLSSSHPSITLGTPSEASAFTLQFAAIRGTAGAGSIRLGNDAGEVRVIISPLGRVRTCASRGRGFTPC